MSLKSIIAILLVICLQIISSQATKIPGLRDAWIVTDVAGKQKNPGDKYCLTILSPYDTVANITLARRGSFNVLILDPAFKLCKGPNKFTAKLPKDGFFSLPNPEYYFVVSVNGTRVDYSGTFTICKPGFGITFTKPKAGDIYTIGQKLKAKWSGSYYPPGYPKANFTLVRFLLEPTKFLPGVIPVTFNFIPGYNVTFSKGCLEFKLPSTIPRNTLYKFGCLITSTNITNYVIQIYSAGTFLIV
ncbi:154_t:CDS:1 [Diversispora eburnea]|uniref:154_t:CDS:1 n=1 Tax=Diversispora eburnea TaxID=1213867 RepID=A0A9N9G793_9GLOM|nr:154_t:CDS:1 [Diversispora eburnea]